MSARLAGARPYWSGTGEIPWHLGRSVVTLGVFDGLHRGHARLLQRAVELGRERDLPVVLTTFDPHPATVAGRARDTTPVVDLTERAALARAHGADAVLVLPFCEGMARTPAVEFAFDVLVRSLRATDVVVGANFRFGHRGAGDARLLRRLGRRHGYTAHEVPLLDGCSSSRVRALVTAGDVAAASQVLGRLHRVAGIACAGGIRLADDVLLPPSGRYQLRVAGSVVVADLVGRRVALQVPDGSVSVDFLSRVVA